MSWDVAFYGELTFPDAEAITRWRTVSIDTSLASPFGGDNSGGTVDDILKPFAGRRLDWIETTATGNVVTVQGVLGKDAFNEEARSVTNALRAAAEVGGRGDVWIVGLETNHSYQVRVDIPGSVERAKHVLGDPRLVEVTRVSARRAARPPDAEPKPAPDLVSLSKVKDAARAVEILKTTPKVEYWAEYRVLEPQLPELHARFGADVFPVLVALLERRGWMPGDALGILYKLESPDATALIAEMLSLPLLSAEIATWLLAHPDLAQPVLRRLADLGDDACGPIMGRDSSIAPLGELARRVLDELTGGDVVPDTSLPAALRAKTKTRAPKWFHPAVFARPRLASGPRLSAAASSRLVAQLKSLKDGDASAFDAVLSALDRRSLDTLLLELFLVWSEHSSLKADGYVRDALRLLGGDHARAVLETLAGESTATGRNARALLGR